MWKSVMGFEGLYEVSDDGLVRSCDTTDRIGRFHSGTIKSACNNGTGYLVVNLKHDGKSKMKTVHRLVAEAFLPNPDNLSDVNHKDGNKQNNSVSNLEWCTHQNNQIHAFRNGLIRVSSGFNKNNHKLTPGQVEFIRKYAKPYSRELGYAAIGRKFGCSATTIKYCAWGDSYS